MSQLELFSLETPHLIEPVGGTWAPCLVDSFVYKPWQDISKVLVRATCQGYDGVFTWVDNSAPVPVHSLLTQLTKFNKFND